MTQVQYDPDCCDRCGEPLDNEPKAEVYLPAESAPDVEAPVYVIHQSCMTDEFAIA
jgi:hypothetical protein